MEVKRASKKDVVSPVFVQKGRKRSNAPINTAAINPKSVVLNGVRGIVGLIVVCSFCIYIREIKEDMPPPFISVPL